ncbi:DUF1257 domain-containing protein [Actinomadura sp. 3N508]|uniref:DUF1257 domain-containing protein n=1 Tax=Actinomadura sp. 3N508 TaxID=3375153 RepID=UPI003789F8E6
MSHFTRVRTTLRDADLLAAALAAVGFASVETHDEPEPLYGYQGDARPERAEVVVRRRHIGSLSNDLGFRRRPDGTFEAIISGYDLGRFDQAWLASLNRAYGHAAALRYAADNGYEIDSDVLGEDGERRLILRRYT